MFFGFRWISYRPIVSDFSDFDYMMFFCDDLIDFDYRMVCCDGSTDLVGSTDFEDLVDFDYVMGCWCDDVLCLCLKVVS